MADNPLRIILNTPTPSEPTPAVESVPLQPVPAAKPIATPKPVQPLPTHMPEPIMPPQAEPTPVSQAFPAAAAPTEADSAKRRQLVEQELQRLSEEESSLLNTLKDWMSKIQGVETKQQALERELFELDRKLQSAPSPEQVLAKRAEERQSLQGVLKQAESKVSEISKQQKIDEKKAFDNYAAGGVDRQGLMDEMERISDRYANALAEAKQVVSDIQQKMDALDHAPLQTPTPVAKEPVATPTPVNEPAPAPEPDVVVAPVEPQPAATAAPTSGLAQKLTQLPGFSVHSISSIERAADGTGIIINQQLFIADADLLRVNTTAEDIIPLPVSTKTAKDVQTFTLPA